MKLLDHQGLRDRGIPYDRSHLWRLCKKGEFPKPVPLGANRIAWLESEIEAWIKKRVAARDSRGEAHADVARRAERETAKMVD